MNLIEHKCDYGCGKIAKYQLSSGKYCCSTFFNSCDAIRLKSSLSLKGKNKIYKGNGFKKGNIPWNKGLSKETDERIISNSKNTSVGLKKAYALGEIKSWNKGLTKETDKRVRETSKTMKMNKKSGGFRHNTGIGKQGWYKGYYCQSSWELAYVIYNLEHNIKFKRNTEGFEYRYKNEIHKYYPDFIENNIYIEIKGYMNKQNKAKIEQFSYKLKVLSLKEIQLYLNYVEKKHGKDFYRLYNTEGQSDVATEAVLKTVGP